LATVLDPRFKETAFHHHANFMNAVTTISDILKDRSKVKSASLRTDFEEGINVEEENDPIPEVPGNSGIDKFSAHEIIFL